MLAESLTIKILGDSAPLRQELEHVLSRLEQFSQRVSGLESAGGRIAGSLSALTKTALSLEQVSNLLGRIQYQIQRLAQTPITLNVQPAMGALGQLSAMLDALGSKLSAVSLMTANPLPVANPLIASPATAKTAGVGSDVGPWGANGVADTALVAALIPSENVIQGMNAELLNNLSQASEIRRGADSPPVHTSSTTNHFGGITINVREAANVNDVIRDLRFQGIRLRNHRG